ncbi:hypothetical protein QFC24_003064 [Naganishia onofrii]|uniref:Uncharacterized protein n=1 Tax=Naganishia onofrii TaxID=1851511 RepID=A0ACC2XPT3_9TREE|nr:hypothetical protein QFC24_003064 [Naganishia onofrii]
MRDVGVQPTRETYHAIAPLLAQEIDSPSLWTHDDAHAYTNKVYARIEEWNAILGVEADDMVGRTIVQHLTRAKSTIPKHIAQQILSSIYYDISLQRPFAADEYLSDETAAVYILWLCDAERGNDLQGALSAFTYFLSVYDVNKHVLTQVSTNDERTPIQQMSAAILTMMAKTSKDVAKQATPFLDDLRERGFTISEVDKMRIIKRLMESTKDHYDAFKIYSWVRALNRKAFKYEQYQEIINHFAAMSLPKSPRVPPDLLAEFITDIKRAGFRMDAKMYTTIISRFTAFLRKRRRQLNESDLVEMVPSADDKTVSQTLHLLRKLHGAIRLDSFLDVDIPLLNALMDAYNQLGAWPECFTVWQELVDRHAWDEKHEAFQPSLSIIFDACGYSKQLARGRRIWRWATKGAVPVNQNNLSAWVECLCRSGLVMEATSLLCQGLQEDPAASELRPEKRVLEIPLKFAWNDASTRAQVQHAIREAFPEEWPSLRFIASRSS